MSTTTGQQNPAGASPFAAPNGSLGSLQGSNAPVTDANEYDSEGRIVGFVDSAGNKTQWSFDSQGRKVDRAAAQQTQEERLDNTFNQCTSVGGVAQTYDLNGNLTSDGTRIFKWDAFNRLSEVTTTTGTLIASYTYGADGRRLRKTLGPAAPAGLSTDYRYAGQQVLEESVPTSAAPRVQYVYGNDIDEVLVKDENRDGDMTCTGESDGRLFMLLTDTYSLAAVFKPGVGIVEAFEFNPYGPAVRLTDGSNDGVVNFDDTDIRTPFDPSIPDGTFATLYGGHPVDVETGLIYDRNRYYDARLGRFVSTDPLGYADSPNGYLYVRDNPAISIDPLGLITFVAGAASSRPPLSDSFDPNNPRLGGPSPSGLAAFDYYAQSAAMHGGAAIPHASAALLWYLNGRGRPLPFDGSQMLKEDLYARQTGALMIYRAIGWIRSRTICGEFYGIPNKYSPTAGPGGTPTGGEGLAADTTLVVRSYNSVA